MDPDLQDVVENMRVWAKGAGAVQLKWYRQPELFIEKKSTDVDLVTIADKECENYILERIRESYPEHSILAEESGENDRISDWCWVVDPLDGTINFAQGIPVFSVSIALQHKGVSVAGVVYNPVTDQLFSSVQGGGAWLDGSRLQVSSKVELNQCVLATGFPYDRAINSDNNAAHFAAMVPKVRGLRRLGSAAYDLANVAAGAMDGYWELGLSLWDVAAGTLLVEEAGGVVLPWKETRGISLIAGNPELARTIRGVLLDVDKGF